MGNTPEAAAASENRCHPANDKHLCFPSDLYVPALRLTPPPSGLGAILLRLRLGEQRLVRHAGVHARIPVLYVSRFAASNLARVRDRMVWLAISTSNFAREDMEQKKNIQAGPQSQNVSHVRRNLR